MSEQTAKRLEAADMLQGMSDLVSEIQRAECRRAQDEELVQLLDEAWSALYRASKMMRLKAMEVAA